MTTKAQNVGGRISYYDPALSSDWATGLWRSCPLQEYMFDPSIGKMWREDWNAYDATDEWTLTQATTGAAAISTTAPGVLALDCNSETVTQGATLQNNSAVFVPAAGKHIWAEFNVAVELYANAELFIGLSETDTTLIATSANSSANHIGWQCVTDDGVLLYTSEKATAGTTSACATLTEGGWIKLGFYVDGVTSVQQYVNGVATGTAHATANVPILAMYPSFVCQSDGADDPILSIGACQVFQLR